MTDFESWPHMWPAQEEVRFVYFNTRDDGVIEYVEAREWE